MLRPKTPIQNQEFLNSRFKIRTSESPPSAPHCHAPEECQHREEEYLDVQETSFLGRVGDKGSKRGVLGGDRDQFPFLGQPPQRVEQKIGVARKVDVLVARERRVADNNDVRVALAFLGSILGGEGTGQRQ